MKSRHVNIPIFIPHLGCPNDCVFCNQRTISGVDRFEAHTVVPIIEGALSTLDRDTDAEIAFFGGSFTGIERNLMIELLSIANAYLKQGRISSIRCSTRPDYINDDILDILMKYGVVTVELGLQSISDRVLNITKRGHTYEDEARACRMIKERGLRLGGQMMIGLPGATFEDELATAEFISSVRADEARIYPTIVFHKTELCQMTVRGEYTPLSIDEAVKRSAGAFKILMASGVKVLRIGLCDSENLHSDSTYFAGPNHAAIGELVEGEYYYELLREKLLSMPRAKNSRIRVLAAPGHTSKIVGQNKRNKIRLLREFGIWDIKVSEDKDISVYSPTLKIEERK